MNENLQRGWQAKLELDFAASGQRTLLKRRSHVGPLQVQRPFVFSNLKSGQGLDEISQFIISAGLLDLAH